MFFAAADWEARAAHVQTPGTIRPLMEQYYRENPEGPVSVRMIQLLRHDKAPASGGLPHCVFQVSGGDLKQPLPVMVEETPAGWKVDWLTFTEFKDDLLAKFMAGPQEEPKRFHVMIRKTHYFDDDVPNLDELICFEIQPPMPGYSAYVFARKGTELSRALEANLRWEMPKTAVVAELLWHSEGPRRWVELTAVPQYNWKKPDTSEPGQPSKAELVE
jgi:hypothetical protein